jgi:aldose 1-epimerase
MMRHCILLAAWLAAISVAAPRDGTPQRIQSASFGRAGDENVQIFTLTNVNGIEVRVMTYGAALVSLRTPDRNGNFKNIVLGFDSLEPYLAGVPYFGATVGRYANRIANGRFTLDGKTYQLPQNNAPNSLHGGTRGFDKRVWQPQTLESPTGQSLRLSYRSAAGEEGYPGELIAHVTYRLSDDNSLAIDYEATTTAPTPVNLTNHAYFNLTGDPQQSILGHVLIIHGDRFTPVNATLIPIGERPVAGTPFDFRKPRVIGSHIDDEDEQLRFGHGYDHNWVLDHSVPATLATAAVLTDPQSGRTLEIRTTQPGLQFYSGNFLGGNPVGGAIPFQRRTGLCLETQHFPDSPNQGAFPPTILRPGQVYSEKTLLVFRVSGKIGE